MAERGFILLEPGPLGRDELRGDVDLVEAHNLTNIANHVISGRLQPGDYIRGVPGMGEFRKGPGLELAPVAEMHPASIRPDLQALRPEVLQQGFVLLPGRFQLSESEKGTPVASALSMGGTVSAATGSTMETAKEKKKRDKKEKKRKRDEPKDTAAAGEGGAQQTMPG